MRHQGFALLVAGSVVVLSSVLIHPQLAIVLAPVATGLYALGIVMIQAQRKRGGVATPLRSISLIHDRPVLRHKRYIDLSKCRHDE